MAVVLRGPRGVGRRSSATSRLVSYAPAAGPSEERERRRLTRERRVRGDAAALAETRAQRHVLEAAAGERATQPGAIGDGDVAAGQDREGDLAAHSRVRIDVLADQADEHRCTL